jgi:hypothetical protein
MGASIAELGAAVDGKSQTTNTLNSEGRTTLHEAALLLHRSSPVEATQIKDVIRKILQTGGTVRSPHSALDQ